MGRAPAGASGVATVRIRPHGAGTMDQTPRPPVRQQLKKPSYPISAGLRAYLKRYRRERELPVTYDRLRRTGRSPEQVESVLAKLAVSIVTPHGSGPN